MKTTEWLNRYGTKSTRQTYKRNLERYAEFLTGEASLKALDNHPIKDPDQTLFEYIGYLKDKGLANTTVNSYIMVARLYLERVRGLEIQDMDGLNRETPRNAATIKDRIPSREEIKTILDYTPIQGKALLLLLLSTGCRIGEALQLRISDLDLDADPARAYIRPGYTKTGEGRTVFISDEARETLQRWLDIKDRKTKPGGGTYPKDKVFGFTRRSAASLLYNALEKAGLDQRDKTTSKEHYKIHLHSFRKYFRTRFTGSKDVTSKIMGHSGYLDSAYLRLVDSELAEEYKAHMDSVSIYTSKDNEKNLGVILAAAGMSRREFVETANNLGFTHPDGGPLTIENCGTLSTNMVADVMRKMRDNQPTADQKPVQRVVTEDELPGVLEDGARVVTPLNNGAGKVVVELDEIPK